MVNVIAIFILLLAMGLSINAVRAAENYNSSKSNTVTSVAKVHEYVGNILLPYGVGGMEINRVNDALDVGITGDALKVMLGEILGNAGSGATSGEGVSDKVQAILLEFDKLGIGKDGAQAVSPDAPEKEFTEGAPDGGGAGAGKVRKEVSIPDAGGAVPLPSAGTLKDILPGDIIKKSTEDLKTKIEDLKVTESDGERGVIRKMPGRTKMLRENTQTLRQNLRENAKELRDNFRENVKTTIGHVDHGKTGRIALAHGKGLRMINRYRSAIARFDHILGRLESRVQKLEERGADVSSITTLIEEAKNVSVENEVKIEQLKAKYESLLLGENAGRVAKEARAIAKELKSEIENLHAKLRKIADDIRLAAENYNSSKSNTN